MQLLAMLTMLIDHLGIVFFPENEYWRYVGRLALPFYAFALVEGYRRTRDMRRYVLRLAVLAAVSQVPYMYALMGPDEPFEVNVVGTLLVALLVLAGMGRAGGKLAAAAVAAGGCALLELLPFDYGAYLLLLVLLYRHAEGAVAVASHFFLNAAFIALKEWYSQMFSLFATGIVVYAPHLLRAADRIAVPRWLWRAFYPGHLVVLALARQWLQAA